MAAAVVGAPLETATPVFNDGTQVERDLAKERKREQVPPLLSRAIYNRVKLAQTIAELGNVKAERIRGEDFSALFRSSGFKQELDQLREEVHEEAEVEKVIVRSVLAVTIGLSIGYVVWLVRAGVLLSSILSSLPAWLLVDPLPVLGYLGKGPKDDEDDDESLESVVSKGVDAGKSARGSSVAGE